MQRVPAHSGLLALVAAFVLLVSACTGGGGGGGAVTPPPTGPGLFGTVTSSRGGPAVSGATITAAQTAISATTDAQGAYMLSLNPGTYDILAAKPGMAASKFQSVQVQSGQRTTANLIIFPVFDPTRPVAPPTITVSGLAQGQTVSGTISFTANVTASNAVRRIDYRAGNLDAFSTQGSAEDRNTFTFSLNTTALANGPAFVDVIAYDLNQNAAELVIRFTVNNAPSVVPPAPPSQLALGAVTTGQSLGLFSAQRAKMFAALHVAQDPNIIRVGGKSVNLLTAPSNATLYVEVSWTGQASATGYKVFRRLGGGPFVQIAQVPPAPSPSYNDADPALSPGVVVSYQVTAFNPGGESAPSAPLSVTPLGVFNVNLTSPVDNAVGVSTAPTFSWTPSAPVGTDQIYHIFVLGLTDLTSAWATPPGEIRNATSVVYGTVGLPPDPLQNGKVYQWDIWIATALTSYGPTSFAVSVARRGGGSLNGPFKFTTVR